MTTFIGDYTCKLDAKGRALLPAAFKKQLSGEYSDKFVIKKDIFENCLVLYPMEEWERQSKLIRKKINPYKKEHNMFLRRFFKGTAEVILDSNNRLLIPKRLLDEVNADKEIVMAGQNGKIEIWDKASYEQMDLSDEEFANMAEDIFNEFEGDLEE
ncbi:MAG: division/cell wall cluster transcriptional repressor MraZ [Bacteroidales bacterium]|nr:division/cell wall cluster transcriptional repressor MraZ [Bacteroidales bacterium]